MTVSWGENLQCTSRSKRRVVKDREGVRSACLIAWTSKDLEVLEEEGEIIWKQQQRARQTLS